MRTKRRLQAAALIAFAVVLGLFTVQGTYALWSAAASASPGTVTSASFDIALKAVNTSTATYMTIDGKAATLALSPAGTLGPGTSVYGGVVVTNNTNAGGQFNTAITAGQPGITNVSDGTLAGYITVNAKVAASPSDCSASTGFAAVPTAGLVSPAVAKAGSVVFCFQVSLSSGAPLAVKGKAVTIQTTLTARQCGVPSGC